MPVSMGNFLFLNAFFFKENKTVLPTQQPETLKQCSIFGSQKACVYVYVKEYLQQIQKCPPMEFQLKLLQMHSLWLH